MLRKSALFTQITSYFKVANPQQACALSRNIMFSSVRFKILHPKHGLGIKTGGGRVAGKFVMPLTLRKYVVPKQGYGEQSFPQHGQLSNVTVSPGDGISNNPSQYRR